MHNSVVAVPKPHRPSLDIPLTHDVKSLVARLVQLVQSVKSLTRFVLRLPLVMSGPGQ